MYFSSYIPIVYKLVSHRGTLKYKLYFNKDIFGTNLELVGRYTSSFELNKFPG